MARVPEVMVVDQDPQARYEVKQLAKQAQLTVTGEAAFGTEAVSLAAELKPDVIICGMSKPPERSFQTMEALLDLLPETPIVAYNWRDDAEAVRKAMMAGARDFFVMPAEHDRVLESIRSVLEAEERKRLRMTGQAKALGPRGLIVAVFGAKGGIGKSTIAVNLGVALSSELAHSVVVVDADNNFGDSGSLLDLRANRNILELMRDLDELERNAITDYLTQHESGLWVLSAPRDPLQWRSVAPERFRKVVGMLARRFDVVLIDTAGALGDLSLAALEEANMVLWVTSSDFASINNSLIALETLQQLSYPEGRIRLMLNVTSVDDGVRPAKIEEVLGRQFFWLVPYDRQIRLGGQIGKPVVASHPDSRGAQSIVQLARALMGVGPKTAARPASPLRRLFGKNGSADGLSPRVAKGEISRNGSGDELSPPVPRGEIVRNAETH
jgi:pilus assembly protein CpaE